MEASIYFPHFYLANDTLLRHRYLYADSIERIFPTGRQIRDNKVCRPFVTALTETGFIHNVQQNDFDETVNARFIQLVERGFKSNLPEYLHYLGKYEKERASAKTFPMCRYNGWPDVTALLTELNLAKTDSLQEWLYSTRTLTIAFTTIHATIYQQTRQASRCSDEPSFDGIASLIERMPNDDGNDETTVRARLEFPYSVPANLPDLPLERLQTIRNELLPVRESYREPLLQTAQKLGQASNRQELNETLRAFQGSIRENMTSVENCLIVLGEKPVTRYGQYRWYTPENSFVGALDSDSPWMAKDVSLSVENLTADPTRIESLPFTPGCYIWTLESPTVQAKFSLSGLFKKWFSR